jgi:Lon protease-like protein
MPELPPSVPLFPLPNVVLFPGAPLPLHIFEPRYREMVAEVSRRDERLIGMVLLRGDWRKDYYGRPAIFPIGCAGRMVRVEPLADGRCNILLHGVREFAVAEEQSERSFREASVRWRAAPTDPLPGEERRRVAELVDRLVGAQGPTVVRQLLGDPAAPDEMFVNLLCQTLRFSPLEKQALLEAGTLTERAARLCEVVQFALEAGGLDPDTEDGTH